MSLTALHLEALEKDLFPWRYRVPNVRTLLVMVYCDRSLVEAFVWAVPVLQYRFYCTGYSAGTPVVELGVFRPNERITTSLLG
jgi:hypothetical protein